MQTYDRHTLLDIDHEGRLQLFLEAVAKGFDREVCEDLLLPEPQDAAGRPHSKNDGKFYAVPGIVRREEASPKHGAIAVGFTSKHSSSLGRLRIPAFVYPQHVVRARDPFEVLGAALNSSQLFTRTPALQALAVISSAGLQDAALGVWGSAGMELATGYEYTHNQSDLDILLRPEGPLKRCLLDIWLKSVLRAEQTFGIRIDAEIQFSGGYGASLKECCKGPVKVLCKGLFDVKLLPYNQLIDCD